MANRLIRFLLLVMIGLSAHAGTASAGRLVPETWRSEHFQDHPLVGRIVSEAGEFVSENTLTSALIDARYVLVGETHTNIDHHQIQANVVQALLSQGHRPHIVFEMVPKGMSSNLGSLDADGTPEDWDAALQWTSRGWPDMDMYRPIFDTALPNKLPLLGGNIDRRLSRTIARQGMSALSKDQHRSLMLTHLLNAASQSELMFDMASSHCGLMPKEALPRMADVQRTRDGAMAATMAQARNPARAVLIAGSGHVRKDRGVPFYLMANDPESISLSIGIIEVDDGITAYSDYSLVNQQGAFLYDFVIFTPKSDISDPCVELKKRFKK